MTRNKNAVWMNWNSDVRSNLISLIGNFFASTKWIKQGR